ncbi:uncharacterized protein LOC125209122 [Salvia hispanica]|uniref:uncharacterized protein LOC125209122 n=1 Tax=Salvia hispanica TaxID=49212 RepID=UPI0020092197|nr:uncharacterized protein LOC125209122 [Salvia hispanica]
MFEEFKKAITEEFEMVDIGLSAYYLGVEVKQLKHGVFITQELRKGDPEEVQNGGLQPNQHIGGMRDQAVGYILRYRARKSLHGESNHHPLQGSEDNTAMSQRLVGYNDSDWAGNTDDRNSTSEYVFYIEDNAFIWMSSNPLSLYQPVKPNM